MIKINKERVLVLIVGHRDPHFLIDTADSVKYFNKDANFDIVFAIDYNKEVANKLIQKYGEKFVFVSKEQNKWDGVLRTVIYAIEYFRANFEFDYLIVMDCDSLCVGPFINYLVKKITSRSLFVGTIWHSPDNNHPFHYKLYFDSGFLGEKQFNFQDQICAGPCWLWTKKCLDLLPEIGLYPPEVFDKVYPKINFACDQISTYLNSVGYGTIEDAGEIMTLRWRQALPTNHVHGWGEMPMIENGISVIHPVVSYIYDEMTVRNYFRRKRYQIKI
jgi:hypothetical protein